LKALTWILGACASLVLLSACGGKSSTPVDLASVSSVTIDQVAYRKTMTMTINGQHLDQGINVNNPGCLNLTEVAGGSATQRTFTCKIIAVGNFIATITNTAGAGLYYASLSSLLSAPPQVTMNTSMGTIVVELNPAKAPITVDNFLDYVETGFYNNLIFHRVQANYLIQGGGYTANLTQPTTLAPINLEASGLSNTRGTIGMARTAAANSATSQFYFNVIDNSAAFDISATNTGYTVFGTIVSGLNVMDQISAVPVSTQGGLSNVPVTPVVILSAKQTQ
jgi:peptidyl-prolyl cis-trans isomerase A (cyclophilin A)